MQRLPLVSVIMPCYNHGEYVGNAIESILNQTYPNIELIVADNGCTDNSYEVINRYRDRIKILRLEKNDRRLCGDMLREAAAGEYIAQATSDDEWMPEKIELQMEAFLSMPDLQVCFTWALEADENLQVSPNQENNFFLVKNRSRAEWLWAFFHVGNCLCFPSALYKAEMCGYFGNIQRGYAQLGDFYQWIAAVQMGEIYIVEKPMVTFRWHTRGGNANDSAPSIGTNIRTALEYADIVLRIAEDTSDALLVEAFGKEFVRQDAQTYQELLCERFFLLKHRTEENSVFSTAMFSFYYNHYSDMERILQSRYGFTFDHYRELAGQCGIAHTSMMLEVVADTNRILEDDLTACRRIAVKLAEGCYSKKSDMEIGNIIFTWMPKSVQDGLKKLYEVCESILNFILRHSFSLDVLYFEFMQLIFRAYELMNDMREQLQVIGILWDDEEFELFGQLVNYAAKEKIDIMEAIVPYIEETAGRLGVIVNQERML